jgi:hypothetical protein
LHELDTFVEKLILTEKEKSNEVKPYSNNRKYAKISTQIRDLKKKNVEAKPKRGNPDLKKKLVVKRRRIKSTQPNPQYTRIEYVRYADD